MRIAVNFPWAVALICGVGLGCGSGARISHGDAAQVLDDPTLSDTATGGAGAGGISAVSSGTGGSGSVVPSSVGGTGDSTATASTSAAGGSTVGSGGVPTSSGGTGVGGSSTSDTTSAGGSKSLGGTSAGGSSSAPASSPLNFKFEHVGITKPTLEGFSLFIKTDSSWSEPIYPDQGQDAWTLSGRWNPNRREPQQIAYATPVLTPEQQASVATSGFTLTLVARVELFEGWPYTPESPSTIGGAIVSTGSRRFDIQLGVGIDFNTVVVLPTSLSVGAEKMILAPGPNSIVPLTSGSEEFHTYQLVYHPTTGLADLYVDGFLRLVEYPGFADASTNSLGLAFTAINNGIVHFRRVTLTSP